MKINDKTLIAYANSSSLPDREGYLQKKGEVNRGYQKRWFVLRGNLLFYYEKRGDKEPVGVIVLEECTIECHDSSEGFSFMIHYRGTNSRTYVLSSDTQEDMEAWMKALSCASYEYMKLLVSDLQRKLDEVNKVETSKLVKMGDRASNVISQTYDSAFNPKRNGVAVAEEALISFGNNSSPSESQNSTPSARFNPFDPPGSASAASSNDSERVTSPASSSTSVARPLPPPPAVRKVKSMPHDGPRTFNEMHEEFGQLIKLRLQQSVSEPPKRPPRKHPQTLSLDLSSNR